MAARHFSQDVPDEWLADEGVTGNTLVFGRHFKRVTVSDQVPHAVFEPNPDDPDAAARLYVERLLEELDPTMARGAQETQRAQEELQAHEVAPTGAAPEAASEVAMPGEHLATRALDAPTPFEGADAHSKGADAHSKDSTPVDGDDPVEQLDSTLVIEREGRGEPDDDWADEEARRLHEERGPAGGRADRRLEVSTRYEENAIMPLSASEGQRRRPFAFFAAIGAFVARVLHLDDR